MPNSFTLNTIRKGSRVKWSNPGKGVPPSPTPRKGRLQMTLDYGRQLISIYIYIYIHEDR